MGIHHCPHHHSPVSLSGSCSGCFMLVNGIQTSSKTRWPTSSSTRVPQPSLHHT
ncbi:hypothetical protein E2C01_102640 [Portunus trituberculatus]|uniref:Uncharacterized protein n=1 Tax=Portunus trituberculatus TaxID=210409 RepID=A0A5B7K8S1_PORTR|nr:hypothetical protein [Portunus trituberculatus]